MKTYFINNGTENGGPFTIEELKLQAISKATLVWYSGMDEWKYADQIAELQFLFTTPPQAINQAQPHNSAKKKSRKTILGLQKSHFFLSVIFVVIMIFILVINIIQYNKKSLLDEKNKKTEFANEKIKLEQKVSTEQRIQEEIQKKIATENSNNFKKDSITNRIAEVKVLLSNKKNLLVTAENDLISTLKFKLLRSEEDKTEQLDLDQNAITILKKEIDNLDTELNRLYLQLETIH
jgi:preprotein translocase subunit SecG